MLDARRDRKTSIENRVTRIEMFTVSIETHFLASHRLTLPDGRKEPLHRHNWTVSADVSSIELNSSGLVIDFHQLKQMVDNIVSELDNIPLEEIDYFQQNNSSAETISKYIYEKLEPKLPKAVILNHIRISEEPGC